MTLPELRQSLEQGKYIFDEDLLVTLFIAVNLNRPLLVEGAAGVGKTEIAKVLATALGAELIRLQCYQGLDEAKAIYEWNYHKQLLSMQLDMPATQKSTTDECRPMLKSLFTEEFLLKRPILKAIDSETPCVLLIDEIDKSDEEFEAYLLEILSDFQVSIPELGTIKAKKLPVVVLTSNATRELSDALKRRCAYCYIDYPTVEKEVAIIEARLPHIPKRLAKDAAEAVAVLRADEHIFKKPSIAETLDWVTALFSLGKTKLDEKSAEQTIGFLLKSREDIAKHRKL